MNGAEFSLLVRRRFSEVGGALKQMPVDAHTLIALSAPRPVFITGGTQDQWADPVGEFKAVVAAGPVYRLLGKKDLGVTDLPALDTPVTAGDLGWHYRTGGRPATPADWTAFLQFLGKSSVGCLLFFSPAARRRRDRPAPPGGPAASTRGRPPASTRSGQR